MVIGPTATFFSGTKILFSREHFKTRRQKDTLHSTPLPHNSTGLEPSRHFVGVRVKLRMVPYRISL